MQHLFSERQVRRAVIGRREAQNGERSAFSWKSEYLGWVACHCAQLGANSVCLAFEGNGTVYRRIRELLS